MVKKTICRAGSLLAAGVLAANMGNVFQQEALAGSSQWKTYSLEEGSSEGCLNGEYDIESEENLSHASVLNSDENAATDPDLGGEDPEDGDSDEYINEAPVPAPEAPDLSGDEDCDEAEESGDEDCEDGEKYGEDVICDGEESGDEDCEDGEEYGEDVICDGEGSGDGDYRGRDSASDEETGDAESVNGEGNGGKTGDTETDGNKGPHAGESELDSESGNPSESVDIVDDNGNETCDAAVGTGTVEAVADSGSKEADVESVTENAESEEKTGSAVEQPQDDAEQPLDVQGTRGGQPYIPGANGLAIMTKTTTADIPEAVSASPEGSDEAVKEEPAAVTELEKGYLFSGPGANQMIGDTDRKTISKTSASGNKAPGSNPIGSGASDGSSGNNGSVSGRSGSGSAAGGSADGGSSGNSSSGSRSSGNSSSGSGSSGNSSDDSSSDRKKSGGSSGNGSSGSSRDFSGTSRTTPKTGDSSGILLNLSAVAASCGIILESMLQSARRRRSIRRNRK